MTGQALSDRLDGYEAAGARYVRFQLEWSNIQASGPGGYAWGPYDAVIGGLLARGIQPLIIVDDTPTWARPAGCQNSPTCAPADPRQFASFAAAAVARYSAIGVHYWEIWNEPNSAIFWSPHPDVVAYTRLLKDSYMAMKAADPRAVVLTGGIAPAVTQASSGQLLWIAPLEFMQGVYANGGHGYFDGVAVHPYTFPALPGSSDPGSLWYQVYGTPISIRSLMVSWGDANKLIWGTEFGAHTDPSGSGYVDEATQARTLTIGYQLWKSYPWTGPLIWFLYQDTGADPGIRDEWFGLLRSDGSPKPAYDTFKVATGAP